MLLPVYIRIYTGNNTDMEQKETRKCPQCLTPVQGRSDKVFCGEQCRSLANNKKKQQDLGERLIHQTNAILRKNRSVLKHASPRGKTTVSLSLLQSAGFDFRYHTHQYQAQNGRLYNFCYDYGYIVLPQNKVLIVNWQNYMRAVEQEPSPEFK